MRAISVSMGAMLLCAAAGAAEVTVQNDSLTNFGSGVIVTGFAANEKAAAWLTSPCAGNLVAVQVYWQSSTGTAAQTIEASLEIFRSGTFPVPGALQTTIGGPVLNDAVLNEYRYLDENNTIPLSVALAQNETFVVSLEFADPPTAGTGPSIVRDTDGNTAGHNTIYADLGGGNFQWFDSRTFTVNGDWVLRAVVDCQAVSSNADVAVSVHAQPSLYTPNQALTYTIVVSNAGPASSSNTTIVDTFPAALTGVSWMCAASGGASCPTGATGSGNIVQTNVNLPLASSVTYTATGTVTPGTNGLLSNTATAAVGLPATDPSTANNTLTLNLLSSLDRIFADDFDGS